MSTGRAGVKIGGGRRGVLRRACSSELRMNKVGVVGVVGIGVGVSIGVVGAVVCA